MSDPRHDELLVGQAARGAYGSQSPSRVLLVDLTPEARGLLEAALAFYPLSAGDEEMSALVKAAETFASSVLHKGT